VAEHRERIEKLTRRRRWVARHHLPAPVAVRALIEFFRRALRQEKEAQLLGHHNQPSKPEWYARYWPGDYLPILTSEARGRVYSYFLMTLRLHSRTLSKPQHPERWRDPSRQSNAYQRLRCAPDALEAVGEWWLGLAPPERPWRTREEKKALNLCIRIVRFKEKDLRPRGTLLSSMKRMTRALEWENARLAESPRRGHEVR
jgi:hypothetical protein